MQTSYLTYYLTFTVQTMASQLEAQQVTMADQAAAAAKHVEALEEARHQTLDVERKWKESVSAICWSRAYH
jgi:hypothetical protein